MLRAGDNIGPYTLVSKLGRGAFGVVWLAERRTAITTTKVALKLPLDEEINLDAIKREADLWVQASGHPNVLPIIEANIYDDQVVIVSEYAPGGSLVQWLERNGGHAPSIDAAIEMTSGILSGLEHLHGRQIIHRDLKPANILLQGETPRLADFGIARVLKSTSQSGIVAGTPAYMAPEVFDGKRSEQTDLWSVGVIFYQLLSGRLPFPQTDLTSLMGAIVTRNPDPLPLSVPEPLQEIISYSLSKDPAQRYQSAAEMRAVLRRVSQQGRQTGSGFAPTRPTPAAIITSPVGLTEQRTLPAGQQSLPVPTVQPPGRSSRLPWLIGGFGALLLGAVALAVTFITLHKNSGIPTPVPIESTEAVKEKVEREKASVEEAKREAQTSAEKVELEKALREAQEREAREAEKKAEREKAQREAAEREAEEKAKREQAEREAARRPVLPKLFPKPIPETPTKPNQPTYILRCFFFSEPNYKYYVTSSNEIVWINNFGQPVVVGRKIPSTYRGYVWMYVALKGMNYGVDSSGRIWNQIYGTPRQIGYVTKP